MYTYYFKVHTFMLEDNGVGKHFTQSGLGHAESFSEAMSQIETYYGEDLYTVEHLELISNDDLIFLPDDVCRSYAENDDYGNEIACDKNGMSINLTETDISNDKRLQNSSLPLFPREKIVHNDV